MISIAIRAAHENVLAFQRGLQLMRELHTPIGKDSFEPAKLAENLKAFQAALEAVKPGAAKGVFMKSIFLTTTVGPSIKVSNAL